MGAKGTQTSNTAQSQSYTPSAAGQSYLTSALQQGAAAAQLPFNIPQAPVAGFSGLQNQAFGQIAGAQGQAQPYLNQAQNLYSQAAQAPNVSQFYNPMAANVNAQLQNTFGQQQAQTTGQLTQAAGGVGADRISVGQAELANQQGLAQGQTDAQLYAQAQSAAQAQQGAQMSAASGMANTGLAAENQAYTGAGQLLAAGGLQQQLSQAQLNAPYQQQLAQAAFPYQQAQFGAGIAGALAPALGGTTAGTGQTQSQYTPSIWGQIGGAAQIAGAGLGYAFGNRGGAVPGYAHGGWVHAMPFARGGAAYNPFAFAQGGSPMYSLPQGYNDQPINVDQMSIIPTMQMQASQNHQANLNLNPQIPSMGGQQSGSGQGGKGGQSGAMNSLNSANTAYNNSTGNFLGMSNENQDALQDAMEGLARGGVPRFAEGGSNFINPKFKGYHHSDDIEDRREQDNSAPWSPMGAALGADDLDRQSGQFSGDYGDVPPNPGRMAKALGANVLVKKLGYADGGTPDDETPIEEIARRFPSVTTINGVSGAGFNSPGGPPLPPASLEERFDPTKQAINDVGPNGAAFDPQGSNSTTFQPSADMAAYNSGNVPLPQPRPSDAPGTAVAETPANAAPTQGMASSAAAPSTSPMANPDVPQVATDKGSGKSFKGFLESPWAALAASGFKALETGSIGAGGLQGLAYLQQQKTNEQKQQTIEQSAKRLELEAKHHEDQFTRSTPYQQYEMHKPVPMGQTIGPLGLPMTTYGVPDGKGGFTPVQGASVGSGDADNPVKNIAKAIEKGERPPNLTNLGKMAPMVAAQLAKDNFNQTQALQEYESAHKQVLSLNGPQMVRFVGLAKSVDNTIDEVNVLGEQLHNSGVPLLNHAKLLYLMQTEGNSERGKLATRYINAVNTVKEEFANAANGGYAPTEPAWKLANEQINGDYGEQQLRASLSEVQRLIRYRLHSIPNMDTLGPGAQNRYVPSGQQPQGQGAQPPAGGGGGGNDAALSAARAAIAAGKDRNAVIQRLKEHGIDPTGL